MDIRMLEFRIDKTRDPDGSQLHVILGAQLRCERMGKARSFLTHLLAITGAVIWLATLWPSLVGREVVNFALAAFGGFFILALGIIIEEIAWCIRLRRALKASQGIKLGHPSGGE